MLLSNLSLDKTLFKLGTLQVNGADIVTSVLTISLTCPIVIGFINLFF
jgi:hypothetical protein